MGVMTQNATPMFLPLTGLYEPSAIQQLPDGRFLVVEDEKEHPFSIVAIGADGLVKHTPLNPGWFESGKPFWRLDDLEGLTLDSLGFLYAVTSHSREENGDEKKSRDKLVRFQIEGERVVAPLVVGGLKRALVAAHALLATAAEIEDAKSAAGLNIEALEITPDRQRLLVGFRSPLQDGHALIASVENAVAIFESGAPPQVSPVLQALDLGGQGIRGMSYIASLDGYLVISGPVTREKDDFRLWFWSGQPGAPAHRVSIPGLRGLERAEGLSPALMEDGARRLVIVSDDGDRKQGRSAHFALVDPAQLQIAA